eukprot:GHVU01207917.1.p1 GENE.GHVU01207917.1~~GHVU01207917.1.p1  ORF type:complete len:102 (+),score=0.93 GHVU01207917.1:504-809(+)
MGTGRKDEGGRDVRLYTCVRPTSVCLWFRLDNPFLRHRLACCLPCYLAAACLPAFVPPSMAASCLTAPCPAAVLAARLLIDCVRACLPAACLAAELLPASC